MNQALPHQKIFVVGMVTVVVVHVPILVIPVSSLDHLVYAVHQEDVFHLRLLLLRVRPLPPTHSHSLALPKVALQEVAQVVAREVLPVVVLLIRSPSLLLRVHPHHHKIFVSGKTINVVEHVQFQVKPANYLVVVVPVVHRAGANRHHLLGVLLTRFPFLHLKVVHQEVVQEALQEDQVVVHQEVVQVVAQMVLLSHSHIPQLKVLLPHFEHNAHGMDIVAVGHVQDLERLAN